MSIKERLEIFRRTIAAKMSQKPTTTNNNDVQHGKPANQHAARDPSEPPPGFTLARSLSMPEELTTIVGTHMLTEGAEHKALASALENM